MCFGAKGNFNQAYIINIKVNPAVKPERREKCHEDIIRTYTAGQNIFVCADGFAAVMRGQRAFRAD